MESIEETQQQEQPTPHTKSSNHSNHIRSRITVVCAECKRLKLRCDRRSPCGSCVKRDTVDRCKYSQAATEKVDLQSVNNRVLALEAQVALLTSTRTSAQPNPQLDRSILAIGSSSSSLAISLDDVASVWLSHLHLTPSTKLKLETAPVELPTDDLHPATLFLPITAFRASSSPLEPPSVTPQLMSKLPSSPELRRHLLSALEDTLAMHPCFNLPHFQSRIHGMFTWAKEIESPSVRDPFPNATGGRSGTSAKPTLSFFAAVSAAFALGALWNKISDSPASTTGADDHNSITGHATPNSESSSSPSALLALSEQALAVFEKSYHYDLDYLVAMILQVIFFLHDGKPRLAHTLFPLVGKMVNVARMMGLGIDPDEFPGTYTLFDAETRRRIWWDVFYYDLFVSDCMGHPPLIADNSFTTRLPADVDEQKFNPLSTSLPVPHESCKNSSIYFGLKCRLAQLIKNLKKRSFKDPLGDPDTAELSIEEAAEFESKIAQFTASLPHECQVDSDVNSSLTSGDHHASPLPARSCELNIIANRLIITLYLPFLKANPPNPPHQASLATVNSAHKIVRSMKAWKAWRNRGSGRDKGRWGSFGIYYEYGRILFDAAVVCASMSIDCHDSAFAQCVKDDVDAALEIMKEMEKSRLGAGGRRAFPVVTGAASRLEGNVSEGVAIVELLKERADATKPGTSLKRKRQDGERERDVLLSGFRIPFVGAGVTSTGSIPIARQQAPPPPSSTPITSPTINRPPSSSGSAKVKVEASKSDPTLDFTKGPKDKSLEMERAQESEKLGAKNKGKDKDKGPKYPPYGIRIRPGLAPPYARGRTPSTSPSALMSTSSCSSPHGQMQSSASEGAVSQSYPPTPKVMLPPGPSATPSSMGPPTPMQPDGNATYFSTFAQDESGHMDADSRSSLSRSFPDPSASPADIRADTSTRRYSTPTFTGNSSKPFFDQTYGSTSQSTSPVSTQHAPSFSSMSHNGQYGSMSQPQSDFYMNSSNNYCVAGLVMTGTDPSASFGMTPTDDRQQSSHTSSSYMGSLDKIPMGLFSMPMTEPASSDPVHFNGPDRGRGAGEGMEMSRGQEWLSVAAVNSVPGGGDHYWTLKPHPE